MVNYQLLKELLDTKKNISSLLDDFFKDEFDSHLFAMILIYISENNQIVHQKDIEDEFKFKKSTTSDFLNFLEKEGYIVKLTSPNDSRYKEILLTNKAKERIPKYKELIKNVNKALTDNLGDAEIEKFKTIIEKLNENIRRYSNDKLKKWEKSSIYALC